MRSAAYNKTIKRIVENPPGVDIHKKSRSGDTAISITLSTKAPSEPRHTVLELADLTMPKRKEKHPSECELL